MASWREHTPCAVVEHGLECALWYDPETHGAMPRAGLRRIPLPHASSAVSTIQPCTLMGTATSNEAASHRRSPREKICVTLPVLKSIASTLRAT